MELTIVPQEGGLHLLKLAGRMDINGTEEVDLRLNAASAEDRALLIVDLSDVDFMSSIGIGTLVRVAKAVRRRGGNLVLLNPRPVVKLVLEKTSIPSLISIHDTIEDASRAVRELSRYSAS